jgi:methionyl-tRNA formyltransferase
MRILFIGTGDIGLPTLRRLIDCPQHQVIGLVTQPDKPVGRKAILTPPATKTLALQHHIPVFQPAKIRHALAELAPLQPDIAVVIAYGQILSQPILNLPTHGCLNIHASLLPKYRGAAPIQAAIQSGDPVSGVTIMQMDIGLDTGDILHQATLPISPDETGGSLHDKLATLAPNALLHTLEKITSGSLTPKPQDHSQASHIGKLTRQHGLIDWTQSATQIERTQRAYTPWPGSHTTLNGSTLKIHRLSAHPEISSCPIPGTVLSSDPSSLLIATGQGAIAIHELQAESGKRLPTAAFLNGHPIPVGSQLGS